MPETIEGTHREAVMERTIAGVLGRMWFLALVLGGPPIGFCIHRLRSADPEDPVETLLWARAIVVTLVVLMPVLWLIDYLNRHSRRPNPDDLSMRASPHQAVSSPGPTQSGGAPSAAPGIQGSGPTPAPGGYAVVQRPNQEVLLKALNIYRDVMRTLVLDGLRQAHGQGATDAVRTSLSDEAAQNFERDLVKSGGNLQETLDIGHFRPVIESNWDRCFSARFRHDRKVLGTLGWINGARNQAAHPGTSDLDASEVVSALGNIARVMDHAGATNIVQALEQMKDQVRTTPARSLQLPAPVTSKCANARCDAFNTHEAGADGRALVRCGGCSTWYSSLSFVMVRFVTDGGTAQAPGPARLSMRIRLPDGSEDIFDLPYGPRIVADRGDAISVSYDAGNQLVFVLNCGIDRTWYFRGGDYRGAWQKAGTYWLIVFGVAVAAWLAYGFTLGGWRGD